MRSLLDLVDSHSGHDPPQSPSVPSVEVSTFATAAAGQGLRTGDIKATVLLGTQAGRLLEGLATQAPQNAAVLIIEPDPAKLARLVAYAGEHIPRQTLAQYHVLSLEADDASKHGVYRELAGFLLAQGLSPASVLVLQAPAFSQEPKAASLLAELEDLLWMRGTSYVRQAQARGLSQSDQAFFLLWGDALARHEQTVHALRLYWALATDPDSVQPALARRIMQTWYQLGCFAQVIAWVTRSALPEAETQTLIGDLKEALVVQRKEHDTRLHNNLAHLAKTYRALGETLAATKPSTAELVWLGDHPWELRARRPAQPVERGDYPLLVQVQPGVLTELNPPDRPAAALAKLSGIGDVMSGHACIGSLTRCDATTNILFNPLVSSAPNRQQAVYAFEKDLGLLRRFAEVEDLRPVLDPTRLELWWGPRAEDEFAAFLRNHPDRPLPKVFIGGSAHLHEVVAEIGQQRYDSAQRAGRDLRSHYATWSCADVLDKLERAEPLQVWAMTSRHTTVLRYITADLAEGFRALGHRFELVIEQDNREQLGNVTTLTSLNRVRPDLILLLDHLRPESSGIFPPNVPLASWLVDELPQLFYPRHIEKLGPLDLCFAWGPELAEKLTAVGYPHMDVLPFAANPEVYYPASPGTPPQDSVAFATHLSLPPESAQAPGFQAHIRALLEAQPQVPTDEASLAPLVERTLVELGLKPGPQARQGLTFTALLLARHVDRIKIADALLEAGIALACYGRGWEQIERFAPHAHGVVDPGEGLRQLYQRHKVVLHVNSTRCSVHPRVLETLLSGGFVLARSDGDSDRDAGGVADHFEIGHELCLFNSLDDMVAKVRRAFDDTHWRAGFVAAGRARVLADHTFSARARTMLKVLQAELRSQLQSSACRKTG